MSSPRMASLAPARKVWIGAAVGAFVVIIVWIIETVAEVYVPAAIATSMVTVVTAITQYLVPPASDDGVINS